MPILPRLTRLRLCLAGFLRVAAAQVVVLLLTAPGPMDAAKAKYDRIQVGMTQEEVGAIMSERWHLSSFRTGGFSTEEWLDHRSGATIQVTFDSGGRLARKEFDAGDQSFRAQVGRLKDRLTERLHHGP
jgi:hypothetical protein